MSSTKVVDNGYARTLKALHKPGNPVVFANIFDPVSATALLSLNESEPGLVKAVATASYAVAAKLSIKDEELSLPQNLSSVSQFALLIRKAGLPLSIDLQDGYGDQIVEAVKGAISIGAVGANIEDSYPEKGFGGGLACLRSVEEAAERIRYALEIANNAGVPDFVINARTDVLCLKPHPEDWTREMMLEETVKRGKAYLAAGATSIFVWGGPGGTVTTEELNLLVEGFGGRLAVKLGSSEDDLSVKELADIGVSRISIGPSLLSKDPDGFRSTATRILKGGKLWSEDE